MRTNLDFSPFFRSTIGFDRVFSLLEDATRTAINDNGPVYDIARVGEDSYRITLAVPGFDQADLTITQQGNALTVAGKAQQGDEAERLYGGLNLGSFTQRFELADFVEVAGAELRNGLLSITLKRELPEAMKPRQIPIGSARPAQIEQRKAA